MIRAVHRGSRPSTSGHLVFVRRAKAGLLSRPAFRLPGSPVTETSTIAFLLAVLGSDEDRELTGLAK
ncbi:hypothetical protein [Streptomyces sp. NPDC057257]|uniref:hypothetical protein n=1 Tax=Streptomyces sp. NPDC057257 TaxID=3346071 RepID=UPI0036425549